MADVFSTYDAVGNREDLADMIYDISPMETPFVSGIAKNTATAVNHEWQTDSLRAPKNNAKREGQAAGAGTHTPTTRLGNYTQISDEVAEVSGTQRSVDSAGRGDEMDYQVMKKAKEVKRDQEFVLLSNKAKVVGDEDTTARELAGVEAWIADNVSLGATGTAPTGDGTDARGAGTPRALTEDLLKDVLAQCYNEGGNPDMIMCGAFNKQAFSGFVGGGASGPAQRNVNGDTSRINTAIDIYVSDFGSLAVVPNRFMEQSSMLVLEMDKWCLSTLRNFEETPLAKVGDSDRTQLISEYTLEAKNAKSSGIIADLTTA